MDIKKFKLIFGMQLLENVINLKVRQGHHLEVMGFTNPLIMVNLGPLLKALYLVIQNLHIKTMFDIHISFTLKKRGLSC